MSLQQSNTSCGDPDEILTQDFQVVYDFADLSETMSDADDIAGTGEAGGASETSNNSLVNNSIWKNTGTPIWKPTDEFNQVTAASSNKNSNPGARISTDTRESINKSTKVSSKKKEISAANTLDRAKEHRKSSSNIENKIVEAIKPNSNLTNRSSSSAVVESRLSSIIVDAKFSVSSDESNKAYQQHLTIMRKIFYVHFNTDENYNTSCVWLDTEYWCSNDIVWPDFGITNRNFISFLYYRKMVVELYNNRAIECIIQDASKLEMIREIKVFTEILVSLGATVKCFYDDYVKITNANSAIYVIVETPHNRISDIKIDYNNSLIIRHSSSAAYNFTFAHKDVTIEVYSPYVVLNCKTNSMKCYVGNNVRNIQLTGNGRSEVAIYFEARNTELLITTTRCWYLTAELATKDIYAKPSADVHLSTSGCSDTSSKNQHELKSAVDENCCSVFRINSKNTVTANIKANVKLSSTTSIASRVADILRKNK